MPTDKIRVAMFALSAVLLAVQAVEGDTQVFDIPRLDNIVIDGKADDWSDAGFMVKAMTYWVLNGPNPPAGADCDAVFRLGWNDSGILLWVAVRDEKIKEHPSIEALWEMDSVGIFLADKLGSTSTFQLQIAPGLDNEHKELRSFFYDRRSEALKQNKLTAEIARAVIAGGYAVEVMIPWKNLGIEPKIGSEIALQVTVYDYDESQSSYCEARWYPQGGTAYDTKLMHRVRLSDKASPPVLSVVSGGLRNRLGPAVKVHAARELEGGKVTVREGEQTLAVGTLTEQEGRIMAVIPLAMPPIGETWSKLTVDIAERETRSIVMPDSRAGRIQEILQSQIHFEAFCFAGKKFPACDFDTPLRAKQLIGPYKLSVQYFDRDFNEVKAPKQVGRYGAVVTIIAGDIRFRRFRTLYCMSMVNRRWNPGRIEVSGGFKLSSQLGIDPTVVRNNTKVLKTYTQNRLAESIQNHPDAAIVLAGLSETRPEEKKADVFNDVFARDRQWWVTFKRKFYGLEKKHFKPVVCPRVIKGRPASTIRKGTLKQAGMKPDAARKIDMVLNEWAADTDQAFAVCVVRHGVIVLHKAYGMRDGRAMTVTTKSNMASITKLIGGTAIMMGVDNGLLDLEAPLDKVHPVFKGIKVRTPLTIRLLCNHWSGLSGHWRGLLNDMEELIALYYPYLQVNKQYEYNSVDIELAGKFLEAASGEAMPQFYKKHLVDPLGLKHTNVTRLGFGTRSIPMDIAKIGQMLLNRGAYGNKRFISEETFEKMLPEKDRRGIGTARLGSDGLSDKTFGHPAATHATIRIDPVNDLVVVMCRNSQGRNFVKYHGKFLRSIVDGIAEK